MTRRRTTRLQIGAYRFLLRRMEVALLRRDIGTINEYGRTGSASLLGGAVLAAAMLAGAVVLGFLRPQIELGQAVIALDRDAGALYVRVDETWHPVLNLASARLIAATNATPQLVPGSALAHVKRDVLLGIPGAPQSLGAPSAESRWAICDTHTSASRATTVVLGPKEVPALRRLGPAQAMLATTAAGAPTYLLYNGQRAVVNLAESAVVRALRLEGMVPQMVSQSLLNAVPEAPPITAPRIGPAPATGAAAVVGLAGFDVGSVLRVARPDGDDYYYVVVGAGVQRIGQVTADLLRFSDSRGAINITAVAPDVISAVPIVHTLPVATFPDRPPAWLAANDTTLCATWAPAASGHAQISFSAGVGLPIPTGSAPVALVQADGSGPAVDGVYVAPGSTAFVRAVSVGADLPEDNAGTRYLITDTGVRFAIDGDETARHLGLPSVATPAPWPVLAVLPGGPELSRRNALVAWDVVAAEPVRAGLRTDGRGSR